MAHSLARMGLAHLGQSLARCVLACGWLPLWLSQHLSALVQCRGGCKHPPGGFPFLWREEPD